MSKTFSKDDVASHAKGDSLWIVIDEDVYDVTKFQDEHPGKFLSSKSVVGEEK
jgi:cytochrome b involved in lipid metabolism